MYNHKKQYSPNSSENFTAQQMTVERRNNPIGAIAAVLCVLLIVGGGAFVLFKADVIPAPSQSHNSRPVFEIRNADKNSANSRKSIVSSAADDKDDKIEKNEKTSSVERITVPDVKTMDVDYAKEKIENAGLNVSIEYEISEKADNTVIRQNPAGNSKADLDSTVILYVSENSGQDQPVQSASNDTYNTYNIYTAPDNEIYDDEESYIPTQPPYGTVYFSNKSASNLDSVAAFGNVWATSNLDDTYIAENVLNNKSTCWCNDNNYPAKGEYVQFDKPNLGSTESVSVVGIYTGCVNSSTQFYNNARPKKIRIEGDNFSYSFMLDTDYMSEQYCVLPQTHYTSFLRVVIEDIEPGKKYPNDACISMIIPYR